MKIPHCYNFKGTYYFRIVISAKYLKNRTTNLILRKSLKQVFPRYYSILENNHQELAKLTIFLSDRVKVLMKHKQGTLEVDEIIDYINELCFEYSQSAIKENSSLETKRIESLEYINENGEQSGYSIQALAKEYKEIITQYNNLSNKEITVSIGSKIVKRSNITKEQLLEIPPDQIITFYEMLIKAEKKVLENDMRLYISRNLHQFISLISDITKDENYKTEEALYAFLSIIRDNELQIDYLNFIKKNALREQDNSSIDKAIIVSAILNEIKEKEKTKVLETSLNISTLVKNFTDFKKYTTKREKSARNAIGLFADFLKGNGEEYKTINISDLTENDIIEFEQLLTEMMPKTKSSIFDNLNLFDLVTKRREENKSRVSPNTMAVTEGYIKDFWRYLCKKHKNLNLDRDLISNLNAKISLEEKLEDINDESPELRAFSSNEINEFIFEAYAKDKFKKIIVNSPRNFYLFVFALFCGTRQEEPLLTHMSDLRVQERDGKKYYYLYLNTNEPYQHLKGKNAHRNIPISDLLIDLGFLNYVNLRYKRGCTTIFDFPKSGGTSAGAFFKRIFQKLFPEVCDTRENRDLRKLDNYIQFRSYRKNFSNYLFEENRTEFDTEKNKERLMGHDNGTSGRYLGRLEPYKAYHIVNAINYEADLEIKLLKDNIKDHFGEILRDLDWLNQKSPEEWKIVSKVKAKRGRKV